MREREREKGVERGSKMNKRKTRNTIMNRLMGGIGRRGGEGGKTIQGEVRGVRLFRGRGQQLLIDPSAQGLTAFRSLPG